MIQKVKCTAAECLLWLFKLRNISCIMPHKVSGKFSAWFFCPKKKKKKKRKNWRKTKWEDDSGSPPCSSIHLSPHLDCICVDVSHPAAPTPANPSSSIPPPLVPLVPAQNWDSGGSLGHEVEKSRPLLSQEHGLADINRTARSIGINLGGTEHVILCGSSGLIAGVIKWAKLDEHGFGVHHARLWRLSSLGWIAVDSSWLEMGLEQGKMYHPLTGARILSSWEKLGLDDWCITLSLDVSEHGMDRPGYDAAPHRSSLLWNGVDKPLYGRRQHRLELGLTDATMLTKECRCAWERV